MPAAQVRLSGMSFVKEGEKHLRLGTAWWGRLYGNELQFSFPASHPLYVGFTPCHTMLLL